MDNYYWVYVDLQLFSELIITESFYSKFFFHGLGVAIVD